MFGVQHVRDVQRVGLLFRMALDHPTNKENGRLHLNPDGRAANRAHFVPGGSRQ